MRKNSVVWECLPNNFTPIFVVLGEPDQLTTPHWGEFYENILLHLTQVIESLSVNTKELAGANHQALQALATRFSHLPQTGDIFEGPKTP